MYLHLVYIFTFVINIICVFNSIIFPFNSTLLFSIYIFYIFLWFHLFFLLCFHSIWFILLLLFLFFWLDNALWMLLCDWLMPSDFLLAVSLTCLFPFQSISVLLLLSKLLYVFFAPEEQRDSSLERSCAWK